MRSLGLLTELGLGVAGRSEGDPKAATLEGLHPAQKMVSSQASFSSMTKCQQQPASQPRWMTDRLQADTFGLTKMAVALL